MQKKHLKQLNVGWKVFKYNHIDGKETVRTANLTVFCLSNFLFDANMMQQSYIMEL